MTPFSFRLYVIGDSPRSRAAEDGLRRLCAQRLGDAGYTIEVVDVERRPDLADQQRILATPTLDRVTPSPPVRVVGDLGSSDELAEALELPAGPGPPDVAAAPDLTGPVLPDDRQEDPS